MFTNTFLYLKVATEQIGFDLIQEFFSFGKYVAFDQVIKIENLYHFYNIRKTQLFGDNNSQK